MWIDWKSSSSGDTTPFRFTTQEFDPETGLYYYGARYLDPRISRWMSVDPAMGEYVPAPGQEPSKLGGMGGIYNTINMHVYHYAANNPVKYEDPDGRMVRYDYRNRNVPGSILTVDRSGNGVTLIYWRLPPRPVVTPTTQSRISMIAAYGDNYGPCTFRALLGIAETRVGRPLTQNELDIARDRFYGDDSSWYVSGKKGGLVGVINLGLEILGSNERASHLGRVATSDLLPTGTEATMIRRAIPGESKNKHCGEGDSSGNFLFDPLGYDSFSGTSIIEYDAFRFFIPKRRQDD